MFESSQLLSTPPPPAALSDACALPLGLGFLPFGLMMQILYDNLLNPVLNIGNPRADERIKYGEFYL